MATRLKLRSRNEIDRNLCSLHSKSRPGNSSSRRTSCATRATTFWLRIPELDEEELESFRTLWERSKRNMTRIMPLPTLCSGHDGASCWWWRNRITTALRDCMRRWNWAVQLQSELSKFHQLEMGPSETCSAFLDRLTAAKIWLR